MLNLIQVFQRIGLDRIKPAVKKPLADLKPACYYGCLLTRPPDVVKFDDPEQPSSMEAIMAVLGAKPVDWNYRTECCGAGMTMAKEETVLELSQRILADAQQHGANCLVTACPMCHVNLDMKQGDIEAALWRALRPARLLPDGRGGLGAGDQRGRIGDRPALCDVAPPSWRPATCRHRGPMPVHG